MAGGFNMKIKTLQMAEESSYDDAATLAAMTGADVIPIEPGSGATYKPQVDELETVAGGWSGEAGVHVGDMIEFSLKAPLRPLTLSASLTERPPEHDMLIAGGFELEAVDESQVTDKDTGAVGDGSTNSFNVTINGSGPVVDGSVSLTSKVGGVSKTITWDTSGVVGGDGTGTIDHNAGTITGAAFAAGAPDDGEPLTITFQKAEEVVENIGAGDGTTTPSVAGLDRANVNRGSISIACDAQAGTDDGAGALDQDDLATGGTVNYSTGALGGALTWDSNTTAAAPIIATYNARQLGPYVLRYTLKPFNHGSACARMLATHSSGAKALAFEATGIRGIPTITAQRRKHVLLELSAQGLFAGWAETSSLPTPAALPSRSKIAHFKASSQIIARDARLEAVDTGLNVSAASGTGPYSGTLPEVPATAGTVRIYLNSGGGEVFTDPSGAGVLVGSNGGTGTVDYATGAFAITLGAAPAVSIDVYCDAHYTRTHSGVLLDLKSPQGAFSMGTEESAEGASGYEEISLDPGSPESELQIRLDLDGFDVRDFVVSQSPIEARVDWRDPLSLANTIRLRQVQRIGQDGLSVGDGPRADVTLKGRLMWGLPDDVGVNATAHGTDPNKDIFALEYRTDPSLAA